MLKTYKVLSLLLSYPDEALQETLSQIPGIIKSDNLPGIVELEHFESALQQFEAMNLLDWQAFYVQTFDYSRKASLYLFEHIQGDSRDRGQAMVDLLGYYSENGLNLFAIELPDYLPVYLEFLSSLSSNKAAQVLGEAINIIARIHEALHHHKNPYEHILSLLLSLSDTPAPAIQNMNDLPDTDGASLDAVYEEKPVEFGNNSLCDHCK